MKLNGISGFLAIAFLLFANLHAAAQINENISVSGEYEPLFIEAERIYSYPVSTRTDLPEISIKPDIRGVVTDFRPSLIPMGTTGWNTAASPRLYRGYLGLNIGSWLNTNLEAGYAVICDSTNNLNGALRFNSTSLFKVPETEGYTLPEKRYRYDGTLMLDYSHRFASGARIAAGADYRLAAFNYYATMRPVALGAKPSETLVPSQRLNAANADVSFRSSEDPDKGWWWWAHAAVNYFGYDSFDYPGNYSGEHLRGDKETTFKIGTGLRYPLGQNGRIGADVNGTFLFYGYSPFKFEGIGEKKDYGIVSVLPSYRFSKGNLTINIGAKLDFVYNAMGNPGEKDFGFFHAAPAVSFDYAPSQFAIHLGATGGTSPVTLSMLEKFDYYQMPYLVSTQPVYEPLKARLAMAFGPFSGFSATIDGEYIIARNTPVGGWYQALLGSAFKLPETPSFGHPLYGLSGKRIDLQGVMVSARATYEYSPVFKIGARASYAPQNGTTGVFNGFDRPEWAAEGSLEFSPVKKLKIDLGIAYRGRRSIYTYTYSSSDSVYNLKSVPLSDLSYLNAGVTYTPMPGLAVYVKGDNLLNRRVDTLPGLADEGLAVCAGVDFLF